jgi:hypothetical protein
MEFSSNRFSFRIIFPKHRRILLSNSYRFCVPKYSFFLVHVEVWMNQSVLSVPFVTELGFFLLKNYDTTVTLYLKLYTSSIMEFVSYGFSSWMTWNIWSIFLGDGSKFPATKVKCFVHTSLTQPTFSFSTFFLVMLYFLFTEEDYVKCKTWT